MTTGRPGNDKAARPARSAGLAVAGDGAGLPPSSGRPVAALRDYVRTRLAGYKVSKQVHVVGQIPKSAVGKVLRRALRDPLWAGQHRTQRL